MLALRSAQDRVAINSDLDSARSARCMRTECFGQTQVALAVFGASIVPTVWVENG